MTVQASNPTRRRDWLVVAALATALLVGGGGSPAPLTELAVQLLVAGLALGWWWTLDRPLTAAVAPRALVSAGLLVAVPLVQFIPLPPALWQTLPGRLAERDALDLVGRAGEWRSLSLAPMRTLASLLALIPAALMLVMAASLDRKGRLRLVATLAAAAVATLVIGAAQISGGEDSPLRFYGGGSTFLDGFQANHNSTADVLLLGLIAAIACIRESALGEFGLPNRRGPVLGLALAIAALLALGVVLTASRAGIALLPIAVITSLALLRPWLNLSRKALAIALCGALACAALGGLAIARNDTLGRVADRFTLAEELRPDLWADSLYAGQTYFPAGAGMGNFIPAMLAGERLEVVRESVPNRAHNDYLELLVEAGALGLAVLAVIALILGRTFAQGRRVPPAGSAALALFSGGSLLVLALHSLVDYPLRSMSIALAAAACAGIVMPLRVAVARKDETARLEEEK